MLLEIFPLGQSTALWNCWELPWRLYSLNKGERKQRLNCYAASVISGYNCLFRVTLRKEIIMKQFARIFGLKVSEKGTQKETFYDTEARIRLLLGLLVVRKLRYERSVFFSRDYFDDWRIRRHLTLSAYWIQYRTKKKKKQGHFETTVGLRASFECFPWKWADLFPPSRLLLNRFEDRSLTWYVMTTQFYARIHSGSFYIPQFTKQMINSYDIGDSCDFPGGEGESNNDPNSDLPDLERGFFGGSVSHLCVSQFKEKDGRI